MGIIEKENMLIMVLVAFTMSAAIALCVTPFSIWVAHKIGAIDIPKDDRRMHKKPIPRFGGLAIFIASMLTLFLLESGHREIRVAMLGGTLMYLLGAADDLKNLKALTKFFAQSGIAILMYVLGIRIAFISNYFGNGVWRFGEGLSFLITILWIVGITNAINLMDGLDGLAAGISGIIAATLAYVAYIHGEIHGMVPVCVALVAISGACAGFLPYNFNPAKTFMGDGGALYLGFMIAVFSVISPLKKATFIAALVPIIALSIPIFDVLFAVVRRIIRQESIMAPDKGHIHHRIMRTGFGQRRAVLIIYGIVGIMGMAAVMISRELYKDAIALFLIAAMYMCVVLVERKPHEEENIKGWVKKVKTKTGEVEWVKEAPEEEEDEIIPEVENDNYHK